MKKKRIPALLPVLCLTLILALSGCTDTGNTGNTLEEPEITVEYLSTEYKDQLLRDGAVYLFGSIEVITDENGNPYLKIAEKEYVSDPDMPNGFYITDKNLSHTYPISPEARTTHLAGGTSIPNIMDTERFVKAIASDLKLYGESNPEFAQYRLYDIYLMGDQVEMILARYIP